MPIAKAVSGALVLGWALASCGRTDFVPRAPAHGPSDAAIEMPGAAPLEDAALPSARAETAMPELIADRRNPLCGNGRLDPGEECDDGNVMRGDGCDDLCQLECDYMPCDWPPFPTHVCGDGRITGGEACDDGNLASGDGCASDCAVELGYRCTVPGRRCTPICGDRRVIAPESCDDGNTLGDDGCSDICLTEPGWDCSSGTCRRVVEPDAGASASAGYCGDGVLEGAEECDDGPANSDTHYNGCSSHCVYLFCGDGIVNGDEQCDLGRVRNTTAYGAPDGCAGDCTRPHYCGDGILDWSYGEQCDPPGSICTRYCVLLID